jgi:pimeloyl-ACP methyl ester carboxylesterase
MKKIIFALLIMLFAGLACRTSPTVPSPVPTEAPTATQLPATPTEKPAEDTASILERLGGTPCPDSDFTCVTLTVPLDHARPDGPTIDVVFGMLPATGERKGMFVTVTGGPGTAGLLSADSYTSSYDPSIPEQFDIVFFDQRGVDLSGGLQCPQAAARFYQADWDASTPEGEKALTGTARTFANECTTEMGHADWLPYLGTNQAIEDLEAFREAMGVDSFWLYGESYGTQYAQTYAAAHPDRVAGLIIDGTVDLTLSGTDFLDGQARAFNDVLQQTLEACNNDKTCATATGGDAISAYNQLAGALKQAPITLDFPLPSGGTARRSFTFSDLETSAAGYFYSEGARMIFLRALAAYSRNRDLVPMARILYDSLSLDPETLEPVVDPSYSDAVYYAVECQDYGYFSGTPGQRAEAYLRAGDSLDASLPNFASVFYGDLPCAFWPNANTDPARPAPLVAQGIPTLVMGATADPATPLSNAQSVFSRLADGYLVTETGGPHIIFGWGVSCVDELVTAFLADDQPPAQRQTTCEGEVTRAFVPLAPLNAAEFFDPLTAMSFVDDEFYYSPEYYYWDMTTPTSIGCPFGGTFQFEASDAGEAYTLSNCSFSEGLVLTGSGSYDYDAGIFSLEVTVSGLKDGVLTYTRDDEDTRFVTGTYDGLPVDLSR